MVAASRTRGNTLSVTDSTVSSNIAQDIGGGINCGERRHTDADARDALRQQRAAPGGGGLAVAGTATVTASTLSGNTANRMAAASTTRGTVTLTNSTLSGNTAGTSMAAASTTRQHCP